MISDPRFAPRRNDLSYLRRRSRKKLRSAPAGEPVRPTGPSGTRSASGTAGSAPNAVADYFSGHRPSRERPSHSPAAASTPAPRPPASSPPPTPPPPRAPAPPPPRAPAPPPPPRAPAPQPAAPASSSLDLDAPAAPPARSEPVSGSLDLDAPATPPSAPAPVSSSLDLDAGVTPRAAAPPGLAPPAPARVRAYPVVRAAAGARTILSRHAPTVTLTRTQSAIGTLVIDGAWSEEIGDLRLGCAYQLASGVSSTVQASGGIRLAPPRSRRPVLVGAHDRYERISVDLRQSRDIERVAVFAFSESRAQLTWGGTVIMTTFAGAKIEIPLEQLAPGQIAMVMTLYNVSGEFVVRAELETIAGSVREACRAYGYDQITWLDDRTPVE